MSRSALEVALGLLRVHADDLFRPRRGPSQLSLEGHLALTLYRFGAYGNLAREDVVADHCGLSVGTVVNATRRVIRGLKRLARDSIEWPNAARRSDLSAWVYLLGLGLALGFLGALEPLTRRPFLWRINRRGIRGLTTT